MQAIFDRSHYVLLAAIGVGIFVIVLFALLLVAAFAQCDPENLACISMP